MAVQYRRKHRRNFSVMVGHQRRPPLAGFLVLGEPHLLAGGHLALALSVELKQPLLALSVEWVSLTYLRVATSVLR
jgi:hypothetical protein